MCVVACRQPTGLAAFGRAHGSVVAATGGQSARRAVADHDGPLDQASSRAWARGYRSSVSCRDGTTRIRCWAPTSAVG